MAEEIVTSLVDAPISTDVNPKDPNPHPGDRRLRLRCRRRSGCPKPMCGKPLVTVRIPSGPALPPFTLERECPRRPGVHCEFDVVVPATAAEVH